MELIDKLAEKADTAESKAAARIALSDDELQKAAGGAPGTCNLYRCDLYRCDFADGCGRSFTADYRPTECPYCGSTCISLY